MLNLMIMIKNILFFILVMLIVSSCTKEHYSLKWKVDNYTPVIYSTKMKIIDSLSLMMEKQNTEKMLDSMSAMKDDTMNLPSEMANFQADMINLMNSYRYFSIIKRVGSEITVEVIGKPNREIELKYLGSMRGFPQEQSFFKGKISSEGKLTSPFPDPKFTIVFELPSKPVSIGESWPLNIKFQKKGDLTDLSGTATKNKVTFVDVLKKGEDLIAILSYEIKSPNRLAYSVLGNAIHFKGKGDFNITQGKWEKFKGYYAQASAGINVMKQTEKIELAEVSIAEFNSFSPLKPQTLSDVTITKKDSKKDKENNLSALSTKIDIKNNNQADSIIKKSDCPTLYSVQILATKEPVITGSKEFKDFDYRVQEKVSDKNNEIYKYKYIVGNFCSVVKARKLRDDIRKSGFPKAFVIKTEKK